MALQFLVIPLGILAFETLGKAIQQLPKPVKVGMEKAALEVGHISADIAITVAEEALKTKAELLGIGDISEAPIEMLGGSCRDFIRREFEEDKWQ